MHGGKKFTPFPVIKTERLILRELLIDDAQEIFALRSDGSVNKYLDRKPGNSIDEAITFIHTIHENTHNNNSIYWAITLNNNDKLIGTICLFNFSDDNLKAEIGYELLPDFQGKGMMQEAIATVINFGMYHIGLQSIEAYTHVENISSTKLLEKFNFKKGLQSEENLLMYTFTFEN